MKHIMLYKVMITRQIFLMMIKTTVVIRSLWHSKQNSCIL